MISTQVFYFCLFNQAQEIHNAKHNTDDAIQLHQRTNDPENRTDDCNTGKDTDQNANNCADHQENNKLNDQGSNILFLYLKRSGPKCLQEIHRKNLLPNKFNGNHSIFMYHTFILSQEAKKVKRFGKKEKMSDKFNKNY